MMKLLSSKLARRGGGAALILGIVGVGGAAFARRPVDVYTQRIETGPVERLAVGTSTIDSEAQISLAFTIPGRISAVNVHEGDLVRAAARNGAELERAQQARCAPSISDRIAGPRPGGGSAGQTIRPFTMPELAAEPTGRCSCR